MESEKVGRVRAWTDSKNWGIISVTLAEHYFLHLTEIKEAPADGQIVGLTAYFDTAEPREGGKLRRAINVRIVASDNGGAR